MFAYLGAVIIAYFVKEILKECHLADDVQAKIKFSHFKCCRNISINAISHFGLNYMNVPHNNVTYINIID